MIRPHLRNKKKELAFLNGNDISECPCCGNWNMWLCRNKNEEDVIGIICTKCGWVCGSEKFRDVIIMRYMEIKQEKEREGETESYRKVGYIAQCFYIIKYAIKNKIAKRGRKRGRNKNVR